MDPLHLRALAPRCSALSSPLSWSAISAAGGSGPLALLRSITDARAGLPHLLPGAKAERQLHALITQTQGASPQDLGGGLR